MKTYGAIVGGAVLLSVVALALGSLAVDQASDDSDHGGLPGAPPPIQVTRAETPDEGTLTALASPSQVLWFVPQDLTTNATVLILDNTNSYEAVIRLTTFDFLGTRIDRWTITIGPGLQGRFCSDPITSTVGGWLTGMDLNFTGAAARALLELPAGVLADGYVVWNGAGGTYDPHVSAQTLPLRFVNALGQ